MEGGEEELFEYRVAKLMSKYDSIVSKPKPQVGDVVMMDCSLSTGSAYILCSTPGIVSRTYDENPVYNLRK